MLETIVGDWVFVKKVLEDIGNILCDHYRNYAYPLNLWNQIRYGFFFSLKNCSKLGFEYTVCHQLDSREYRFFHFG